MVFDGGKLQMKKSTEDIRKKTREANLKKAEEYMRKGYTDKAIKKFGESIDITPKMAHILI